MIYAAPTCKHCGQFNGMHTRECPNYVPVITSDHTTMTPTPTDAISAENNTAEEFFRDKIKSLTEYSELENITLWQCTLNGEQAMRWAHEWAKQYHADRLRALAKEVPEISDDEGSFIQLDEMEEFLNTNKVGIAGVKGEYFQRHIVLAYANMRAGLVYRTQKNTIASLRSELSRLKAEKERMKNNLKVAVDILEKFKDVKIVSEYYEVINKAAQALSSLPEENKILSPSDGKEGTEALTPKQKEE